MDQQLIYMPTFRVRQQETIVLKQFDFGEHMYPLLEVVKEHDRIRKSEAQLSFEEIYIGLIESIKAKRVFLDLPVYLKESGAMKDEVLQFSMEIISKYTRRCEYINKLSALKDKVIPIIASYLLKTGEENTIAPQVDSIRPNFTSIGFRLFPQTFNIDFPLVKEIALESDYLIIDLDQLPPYPKSPPLRPIIEELKEFNTCCKILLRSAINTDIQNVKLDHGQVVYEADNSHIESDIVQSFGVNATGDYVGIKKDDLTAGGTISPGFIYYDANQNQYFGYRATIKKDLAEFENRIVPDVLSSEATARMLQEPVYLDDQNPGYQTLLNIQNGKESGKSQAKFKKIAMDHYLHCMDVKIRTGQMSQQP